MAHEEGNLNDLRAILGNDIAIKASQEGKLPYPDGTIIARLAWPAHVLDGVLVTEPVGTLHRVVLWKR